MPHGTRMMVYKFSYIPSFFYCFYFLKNDWHSEFNFDIIKSLHQRRFLSGIAVSRFLREPSAKICQGKLTNDGNFFVFYNNKFSFCRVVPIDSNTTEKTDKDESLSVFSVVPLVGVEPTRYRYHGILSPARLPIPPQRHYSVRCKIFSRIR